MAKLIEGYHGRENTNYESWGRWDLQVASICILFSSSCGSEFGAKTSEEGARVCNCPTQLSIVQQYSNILSCIVRPNRLKQ